jgi:hypothetical protein
LAPPAGAFHGMCPTVAVAVSRTAIHAGKQNRLLLQLHFNAQLNGSTGSGQRVEPRPCTVNFFKR